MEDEKALNPDITDFKYGKKEMKNLTLYPLSIGDQFKVTDMITEVVQNLVKGTREGQLNDFAFMTSVMDALEQNLGKVLSLIADITEEESLEVIDHLTNSQLVDIIEIIWAVNYEPALKKGKNLFERGKSVFDSKRSSPSSLEASPSTDLKISTEKATDKVD